MTPRSILALALLVGCGSTSSADGGSSSESGSSSSAETTTTGAPPRCGGAPGNCAMYSPCEVCGDLMSPFDENGCLRTSCVRDSDCGMGPRCFLASDFDTCVSSMGPCEDDPVTMTCECQLNNDCGDGGWCVPEDIYPSLAAGPAGVLVVEHSCGPDDGVVVSFRSYPVGTVVDCSGPPQDVPLQLELRFADAGLVGTYELSMMNANGSGSYWPDEDNEIQVRHATLTLADEAAAATDGSYTFVVYDGGGLSLYGGFFMGALSCPLTDPCG